MHDEHIFAFAALENQINEDISRSVKTGGCQS
jgi:hypothetical protein